MKNSFEISKVRFASGAFQLRWGLRLAIRGLSNQFGAIFQMIGILMKLCLAKFWFPFALVGSLIVRGAKALYGLFLLLTLKIWGGFCYIFRKIKEGIVFVLRRPAQFLLRSGRFCWRVFVKFLWLLASPIVKLVFWFTQTWFFLFVCKFSLFFIVILVGLIAYGIVAFGIFYILVGILLFLNQGLSLLWSGPQWLQFFKSACIAFLFVIVWDACSFPNRAIISISSNFRDYKKWDFEKISASIWKFIFWNKQSSLSTYPLSMNTDFALISPSVKSKSFFSFSIASMSAFSFAFLATSCSYGLQFSANLFSATLIEVKVGLLDETSSGGSEQIVAELPSVEATSPKFETKVEKEASSSVHARILEPALEQQDSDMQYGKSSIFQIPSNWREESSLVIERNGIAIRKLEDLKIDVARLCSAVSIVSIGTASADGPEALNTELALSRGMFLARLISSSFASCATKQPDVWVFTQSTFNWFELPQDGRKVLAFDLKYKSTMKDVQRELKRVGAWDSEGKLCLLSSSTIIRDEYACKNESITKWMRN